MPDFNFPLYLVTLWINNPNNEGTILTLFLQITTLVNLIRHAPSERVLKVWGNFADFIIAVKVMISVRSSRLQPVQSPFIRRIRCFCGRMKRTIVSSSVDFWPLKWILPWVSYLWNCTCLIWVLQTHQWEFNQDFTCRSNWKKLISWY